MAVTEMSLIIGILLAIAACSGLFFAGGVLLGRHFCRRDIQHLEREISDRDLQVDRLIDRLMALSGRPEAMSFGLPSREPNPAPKVQAILRAPTPEDEFFQDGMDA